MRMPPLLATATDEGVEELVDIETMLTTGVPGKSYINLDGAIDSEKSEKVDAVADDTQCRHAIRLLI